jgi:hypothetical protein
LSPESENIEADKESVELPVDDKKYKSVSFADKVKNHFEDQDEDCNASDENCDEEAKVGPFEQAPAEKSIASPQVSASKRRSRHLRQNGLKMPVFNTSYGFTGISSSCKTQERDLSLYLLSRNFLQYVQDYLRKQISSINTQMQQHLKSGGNDKTHSVVLKLKLELAENSLQLFEAKDKALNSSYGTTSVDDLLQVIDAGEDRNILTKEQVE